MRWLWCVVWMSACGSAAEPRAPEPTESLPARPAEEAPIAAAPVAPSEVFEPQTVRLGSMALLAERCNVSGAPLEARDAFDAIRAVAWTGGATVWVLDGEGRLRRFVDFGDEACALMPDASFGSEGVFTFADAPEAWSPRSMAVDEEGHVYVSSPQAGTYRLTGDHADYHCETVGRVSVSPNGQTGFGLFGNGPARRIAFSESGCTTTDWAPLEVPSILESVTFVDDERVLVGGQAGREGPHTARLYDLEGHPLEAAFGSEDASAPDRLCYTHAAFSCGDGLCVLDGNCRAILARGSDGVVTRAEWSALTGLGAPWIVPPAGLAHGMTFFGAAQPEVASDGTHHFVGTLFRLHGL